MSLSFQEDSSTSDVVHQVAVRIPLDEVVESCSNRTAATRFKEEVEQLPVFEDESTATLEDESTAVVDDLAAGTGPCLENDKLPPAPNDV